MLRVDSPIGSFTDPDAELLEFMRSQVVDNASSFWAKHDGDFGVHFSDGPKHGYLVLAYVDDRGYYVLQKQTGDRVDYKLARTEGDNTPVVVYLGGEPETLPTRAIIPAQLAWTLVEEFCTKHERPAPPAGMEWRQSLDLASAAEGAPTAPRVDDSLDCISYEQGNEFAPDAPWGHERLRICADGKLQYTQRRDGSLKKEIKGRVDATRFARVRSALERTAFPAPPQQSFLPGASVTVIAREPSGGRVLVDYYDGQKLEGYREILRDLGSLATALRNDDAAALAEWQFAQDPA